MTAELKEAKDQNIYLNQKIYYFKQNIKNQISQKTSNLESKLQRCQEINQNLNLEAINLKKENKNLENKCKNLNSKVLKLTKENEDLNIKRSQTKNGLYDLLNKPEQESTTRNIARRDSETSAVLKNRYSDYYSQSQNEILSSINEIKRLKNLLKSKEEIIELLEMRLQKCLSVKSNVKYYEIYHELLSKLKEIYEWSLNFDYLEKPTVLPSGFTINENIFDRLINNKDPYNKNLNVQHKITNRFANEVREIIRKSENSVIEEEKKIQEEIKEVESLHLSKGTQTDSHHIFDKDSKQIEELSQLVEDLLNDQQKSQELI